MGAHLRGFDAGFGADQVQEGAPELPAQKTVEEEVGASVDAQHGVAGCQEVRLTAAGRDLRDFDDVVDDGDEAADEEANGDAQDYQGQAVLQACGFGVLQLWREREGVKGGVLKLHNAWPGTHIRVHKYTHLRIHEYTHMRVHKYTHLCVHKYTHT